MHSPIDARLRALMLAAVIMTTGSLAAAGVQQEPTRAQAARPDDRDIARALEAVKADPNLTAERTIRTLRWNSGDAASKGPSRLWAWFSWVVDLFAWISQSARILVWLVVIGMAGALVLYIVRMLQGRGERIGEHTFVAPTHVHDLDIRPESLPPDIGAAARALWDAGEHRAALALLYRGLLSRLAHVHHVPIHDSSTEGDCLALAAAHLAEDRHAYASRLVRVWQRFVYGGQEVQPATVYSLCDDFARALDAAAAGGAA